MVTRSAQERIQRLRADASYAVAELDLYLEQVRSKDPTAGELLRLLREVRPDLTGAITTDLLGHGWARSQVARLIMSPTLAKQASLHQLLQLAANIPEKPCRSKGEG